MVKLLPRDTLMWRCEGGTITLTHEGRVDNRRLPLDTTDSGFPPNDASLVW